METLNKINSLLDRIENRVGGSAQIPFINPCPSGEEWLELRRLVNSLSDPSNPSDESSPAAYMVCLDGRALVSRPTQAAAEAVREDWIKGGHHPVRITIREQARSRGWR